jgi:hypothetical protein
MTLYLLKVHLQTFISIQITQKCQILSCDTLFANERYARRHERSRRVRLTVSGPSNITISHQQCYE